ncbi:MAG: YybH family protein [Nodosilinea sp.]
MTMTTTTTQDEAQIRRLIADQTHDICAKDLDQILANYTSEIVIFDMKPPLVLRGIEDCRRMWESSLPYMPTISGMEQQEVSITVSGDLAIAHWISRFTGIDSNHPAAQMWLRITAGCQRYQGEWQIIHEHVSVPFLPESSGNSPDA